MKKATRALSLILSVLMVVSCFAGMTFSFAEDEVRSADYPKYSEAPDYMRAGADAVYINGELVFENSAYKYIQEIGGVFDDSANDINTIMLRGWVGNVPAESFGYAFGDLEPVWGAPTERAEGAVVELGGPNSQRYQITFDLTGLEAGSYRMYPLVKATDGTIYYIDKWTDMTVVVGGAADDTPNVQTAEYAKYSEYENFTNCSTDSFIVNGEYLVDGPAYAYVQETLGGVIDNTDKDIATFALRGWEGNIPLDQFGWAIGAGEPVFGDFTEATEDAVKQFGGENAIRYCINFETAGLADGCYAVYPLVKGADGAIYWLDAWGDIALKVGDCADPIWPGSPDEPGEDETDEPDVPVDPGFDYDQIIQMVDGGQGNPHGAYGPGRSVAFRYTIPDGAMLEKAIFNHLATYNDSKANEIRVDIYQWKSDYATTVKGTVLATYTEKPHTDNQDMVITVPAKAMITGKVLVVATYVAGPQALTPWLNSGNALDGVKFYADGEEAVSFGASVKLTPYVDYRETQMEPILNCDFTGFVEDVNKTFGFWGHNNLTTSKKLNSGYITFTATDDDPYVCFGGDIGTELKMYPTNLFKYAVVKYRSFSNRQFEFFVERKDGQSWGDEGSYVNFDLIGDGQWHVQLVDCSEVWGNANTKFTCLRIDPLDAGWDFVQPGEEIDISYIKFFSNVPAYEACLASEVKSVSLKGELNEGDPAVFEIGGKFYTSEEFAILTDKIAEVEPAVAEFTNAPGAFSADTFFVTPAGGAEQTVQDGVANDFIATQLGGKLGADGYDSFAVRGWYGDTGHGAIEAYGYQIGDAEPFFSADFINPAEDGVKNAGGPDATRYKILVPVNDLANGTYNFYALVKHTDGTVVRLAGWGDIQIVVGDGKNVKSIGLEDADGNLYTLNGKRVLGDRAVDTGLLLYTLDDGRKVAAGKLIELTYLDPLEGAVEVNGRKYTYTQKIAVSDVYTPIDPEDNSAVNADYAGIPSASLSPDTLFYGEETIKDGGAHAYIASLGGKLRNTDRSIPSFSFRGWAYMGTGNDIAAYGYSLNDGDIVWDAGFINAPEPGLAGAVGGHDDVTRYKITVPTADLADGRYNVYLYVKDTADNIRSMAVWGNIQIIQGGSNELTGYSDGSTTYGLDSIIYVENDQKYVLLGTTDVTDGLVAGYDYNTVINSFDLDLGTNAGTTNNNTDDTFNNEGSIWIAAGYTVPGTQLYNLWGMNGQIIFESLPFADYNTVEIVVGSDPSCDAFRVGFVKDVAHLYGCTGDINNPDLAADLISAVAPAGSEGQPNLSGRGEGAGWNGVERLVRLDISDIDYAAPVAISVGSVAPHTMVVAKVTFVNYAEEKVLGKYVYDTTIDYVDAPKIPFDPSTLNLVYILDGPGLNTGSDKKDFEEAEYDFEKGCIRYVSTNGDPNTGSHQIPQGTLVAPWMVVKYRTEVEGTIGEIFIGKGTGATGDSHVGYPAYIADGEWHTIVVNVGSSKDWDASNVINHFRNDCLQGPDQWVEIEYYAFFNTQDEAEYYAANDLHELPQPPKTFTATFMADGEVVKVITFTEGETVLLGIPKVPAKEGFKGKWEAYELADADITINAVYEPKDPVDTQGETEPETTPDQPGQEKGKFESLDHLFNFASNNKSGFPQPTECSVSFTEDGAVVFTGKWTYVEDESVTAAFNIDYQKMMKDSYVKFKEEPINGKISNLPNAGSTKYTAVVLKVKTPACFAGNEVAMTASIGRSGVCDTYSTNKMTGGEQYLFFDFSKDSDFTSDFINKITVTWADDLDITQDSVGAEFVLYDVYFFASIEDAEKALNVEWPEPEVTTKKPIETKAPEETSEPAASETETDASADKGCKSVVAASSAVAMVMVAVAAFVATKKKKED